MVDHTELSESYWSLSIPALLESVQSNPDGLSASEAEERLARFGRNVLGGGRRVTVLGLLLAQFKSPIILILLFATILSAAVHEWVDASIVLAIVLASALLSFVQEYGANRAMDALHAQVTLSADVLRDGERQGVPAAEVVPGDVVLLSAGSLIPADGVVLDAKDFFVSQAALTGETFPVEKRPGDVPAAVSLTECTNTVFMGTNVRNGSARALVVRTGTNTVFGHIAQRLGLKPPETEFERGIRRLGSLLSEVMFVLVLAVFAINVFFHRPILESLLFSIALAVGLTPQLLPAIININLAKGSQAMAAHGVIVRRLASIENFGSMDVLCTDKTGTLTEGVVRLDGALDGEGRPSEVVSQQAFLNAHFQTGLANPLDEAVLAAPTPDVSAYVKVDEIPYDFVRKRMSVVVRAGDACTLVTKGALINVLEVCTQIRVGEATVSLDDTARARIQERFETWSAQGYRVLGVSYRTATAQPVFTRDDERDLVFSGFLLFFDPPKTGAEETIRDLQALGVRLKIVTGDNRLVALHVVKSLGLESAEVMTGSELQEVSDEALPRLADRCNLFAEVDPNQKERIILALQKAGDVVGYMGDGINDAPALHAADVGISVAGAVDVAKQAAEFVLLEKDLRVLAEGIVQGRKTFANTLKYVFMATSANFGNMFSVAGASLFLTFLPMLPKQILLINFLTDLPEMAIAGDHVDPIYVQKPHRWDIRFIRRFMVVFGPLSSLFDFATFGVLLLLFGASPELFRTGWFVESVVSASLVVFVLRTRLPLSRSRPYPVMVLVAGAVVMATVAIPYTPIAGLLGFLPLPPLYLAAVLGIVVAYVAAAELTKRAFYRWAA